MKRIILVRVRSSKTVSNAHHVMFHGTAFRDGISYPFSPSATSFNEVRSPLELVHSKQLLPDVFQPAENFVLSEQVAESLKDFNGLAFLPVQFDKLVDFYFEKGTKVDCSFKVTDPDVGELTGPGNFLFSLPDHAEAHDRISSYCELLVPTDRELKEKFPDAKRTEIDVEPPEWDFEAEPLIFSEEMLEAYPVIRFSFYHHFSPAAFSVIEPFLDRDYFQSQEVNLD